jgi:hypothetical protein
MDNIRDAIDGVLRVARSFGFATDRRNRRDVAN